MSLFAFQDVIMSVSGILIVIMLLLSLELVTKTEPSGAMQAAETAAALQAEIVAATAERQELEQSLQSADQLVQAAAALSPEELRRDITRVTADADAITADLATLDAKRQQVQRELQVAAVERFDQQRLEAELAALEAEAEAVAEQVEAETREDRPVFSLPQGETRDGWLVVLAADRVTVAPLGRAAPPRDFVAGSSRAGASAVGSFLAWVDMQNAADVYLLMLIRPGGAAGFKLLQPALNERGVAYGYDLVREQQSLLHPERGAVQ